MIQLIRGFKDILPGEVELWEEIEKRARNLFEEFGFDEIRIPIMEKTELFSRSIGEETDIVQKEMYTFSDRSGDLITLRPEATASVVRSYIQHKLYAADAFQKLFVIGPMFRRERPQKGRYRQFYQIDAEVLGVASPLVDVQLILMLMTLFQRLQVSDLMPHVNSLGCPECRSTFKTALSTHLTGLKDALCADCMRRSMTNPLRVLDCKVPSCREALTGVPSILDYLCDDCKVDFTAVTEMLETLGIPFVIDDSLVRGLDYYNRTTFEIQTGALGAQNAIAGGGRYDGLVKMLGGPDLPATGFAIGFDRLVEVCGLAASDFIRKPVLFIAALGQSCLDLAFQWHCRLAEAGIRNEIDLSAKSLKSQMKRADKLDVDFVLIAGEQELERGSAVLRNMHTKEQTEIPMADLVTHIVEMLRQQSL